MKTKQEIEKLAEKYADGDSMEEAYASYIAFQEGYTQCQEDLTVDLYSKIENLIITWSIDGTKTAGTLTRQIIKLLNPQEND